MDLVRFAHRLVLGPRLERVQAWHNLGLTLAGIDVRQTSMSELGLDENRSYWYANSGGPALRKLLRSLPITSEDSAIDVGCGKGGAILTLSRFPFGRVDGLDISPLLVDIARRNLRRCRIRNSSIICSDAAQFRNFDPYTYVYLYHPFPAAVMDCVMRNLRESLAAHPRPLTLIYCNPYHDSSVTAGGFEAVREFTDSVHPIRVYRPVSAADEHR